MKYLIIPIIIVLALLGACKKNSDSAVPDTHGSFMFVNAMPGNAQYDIKLDSIPFATKVAYKTSTGYKSYRAQQYNLIITPTGRPNFISYSGQIFLRNNRFYTAWVGADSSQRPVLVITEDDMNPLRGDSAKVRVIDFSEGFKPNRTPLGMDIYIGKPIFFKGLTFPAQTAFAPVAGDSTYKVNFNYVDDPNNVLKSIPLTTQKGKVYTLVTAGYPLDSARFDVLTIQHN